MFDPINAIAEWLHNLILGWGVASGLATLAWRAAGEHCRAADRCLSSVVGKKDRSAFPGPIRSQCGWSLWLDPADCRRHKIIN